MRAKDVVLTFGLDKMAFKVSSMALSLTYFLIRLKSEAKTHSSSRYHFIFGRHTSPFWGHLLTSILSQTIKFAQATTSLSSISSTQHPIHHRRGNAGVNLSDFVRLRKNRNLTPFKIKRCFPISYRVTHLNQPHHLETLPSSNGTLGLIQAKETSRSLPAFNDSQAQVFHQGDLRADEADDKAREDFKRRS